MVLRDEGVGKLVNLTPDAAVPQDIYGIIGDDVAAHIASDKGKLGKWWCSQFKLLTRKEIRKLCKPPVMTLPYNATEETCQEQIVEQYYALQRKGRLPNRVHPDADYLELKRNDKRNGERKVVKRKGKKKTIRVRKKTYPSGAMGYLAKVLFASIREHMPKILEGLEWLGRLIARHAVKKQFIRWKSPRSRSWLLRRAHR
jgi:hypothetical protein